MTPSELVNTFEYFGINYQISRYEAIQEQRRTCNDDENL